LLLKRGEGVLEDWAIEVYSIFISIEEYERGFDFKDLEVAF